MVMGLYSVLPANCVGYCATGIPSGTSTDPRSRRRTDMLLRQSLGVYDGVIRLDAFMIAKVCLTLTVGHTHSAYPAIPSICKRRRQLFVTD